MRRKGTQFDIFVTAPIKESEGRLRGIRRVCIEKTTGFTSEKGVYSMQEVCKKYARSRYPRLATPTPPSQSQSCSHPLPPNTTIPFHLQTDPLPRLLHHSLQSLRHLHLHRLNLNPSLLRHMSRNIRYHVFERHQVVFRFEFPVAVAEVQVSWMYVGQTSGGEVFGEVACPPMCDAD